MLRDSTTYTRHIVQILISIATIEVQTMNFKPELINIIPSSFPISTLPGKQSHPIPYK